MWYDYYKSKKQEEFLSEELKLINSLKNIIQAKLNIDSQGGQTPSNSMKMNERGNASSNSTISKMNMGKMQKGEIKSLSSMEGNMGGMNTMNSDSTFGEILLLDIQIKELNYKLENKKNSSSYLLFAFNSLLNRGKKEEINISKMEIEYPKISFIPTQSDELDNNPMIKMAFWEMKAKESQKKMANLMGRPMIGIGLSYMRFSQRNNNTHEMSMNMNHMFMPMVSLRLPIYRKKYNARQKEADFLKDSAIYEIENLQNSLVSELEKLNFEFKENNTRYELLQEQIKTMLILIRIKETAFKIGKASLEDLIKQNQKLLNYKKEALEILIKGHKIIAMQNRIKSS